MYARNGEITVNTTEFLPPEPALAHRICASGQPRKLMRSVVGKVMTALNHHEFSPRSGCNKDFDIRQPRRVITHRQRGVDFTPCASTWVPFAVGCETILRLSIADFPATT